MNGRARPELCVGAVVVRGGELLLVERGRGAASGQWAVPGGRVEGGETMAEAVVREVREETGLEVACRAALGWVERISDEHHFVIVDFLAEALDPAAPLAAGDDAADAAWVPLTELGSVELVVGLVEFLTTHGVLPPPAA